MIIQILSDLHVEFHRDFGKSFVDSMDPSGVDVLIIAGDYIPLNDAPSAEHIFKLICDRYKLAYVLFVPGNHEFYGSKSIENGIGVLRDFEAKISNLHVLYNNLLRIGSIDFIGTTLWFEYVAARDSHLNSLLNDFGYIGNFRKDVIIEHKKALEFLDWHCTPDSVVITHHYPLPQSIHPQFEGSRINHFFGCDLSEFIVEATPKMWVHGHTHCSFNYKYADTHVICNPFGYLAYDTNQEFSSNLRVHT